MEYLKRLSQRMAYKKGRHITVCLRRWSEPSMDTDIEASVITSNSGDGGGSRA